MRLLVAPVLVIAVIAPSPAIAQAATFAGTWILATETGRGGRGNIPGVPIATRLTIKVAAGQVSVDSNTGSAESNQTSVYRLDGNETTVPGPLGWTVKARAALTGNGRLVVNTIRSLEGPNGPIGAEVIDVYAVSGDALTIERTQGRNKQTLAYKRQP